MLDIARDAKIYAWYYNNQETHDCLNGEKRVINAFRYIETIWIAISCNFFWKKNYTVAI